MIVTLEVKLETDEAEAGELAIAVKDAITRVLEMPNGDAMYLNDDALQSVTRAAVFEKSFIETNIYHFLWRPNHGCKCVILPHRTDQPGFTKPRLRKPLSP